MIDVSQYIMPELLVMIPVLYVVAVMIKHSEIVKSRWIPIILGVVGVALAVAYVVSVNGVGGYNVVLGVMQGILCAGATVYTHQLYKQWRE